MSPDKKWFWDGSAWRPIPVHEAAFPNWKGIGAGFSPEMAAAPAAPPVVAPQAPRRQAPAIPGYRMAGPAPDVAVPRWNVKPPVQVRVRRYGIMAAGVGVLIAVVALVSVLATLALSSHPAAPPQIATTKPAAGPDTRSDSARATFLVKSLAAPMADLKDTTAMTRTSCALGMTSSCADTFVSLDNSLTTMLPILEKANVPLCIGVQEKNLRTDLAAMNAGALLAYKGFRDNKKSEFLSGLAQVNGVSARVQTEFAAMSSAAAACDSAVTGP
jgi:hypothetical protein